MWSPGAAFLARNGLFMKSVLQIVWCVCFHGKLSVLWFFFFSCFGSQMGRSLQKRCSIWLFFMHWIGTCFCLCAQGLNAVTLNWVHLDGRQKACALFAKELWPSGDLLVVMASYLLCSLAYIYKFLWCVSIPLRVAGVDFFFVRLCFQIGSSRYHASCKKFSSVWLHFSRSRFAYTHCSPAKDAVQVVLIVKLKTRWHWFVCTDQ